MGAITLSKGVAVGGAQYGKFKIGDLVVGRSEWAEYTVLEKAQMQIVQYVPPQVVVDLKILFELCLQALTWTEPNRMARCPRVFGFDSIAGPYRPLQAQGI